MFGVILWSDEQDQKAVIWCEDHGDLAFYRNTDGTTQLGLDAGDWVQFDMKMERNQRLAKNPRLISEGVYPDLAGALCAAPDQARRPAQASPQSSRGSATIIPFAPLQSAADNPAGSVQLNRA